MQIHDMNSSYARTLAVPPISVDDSDPGVHKITASISRARHRQEVFRSRVHREQVMNMLRRMGDYGTEAERSKRPFDFNAHPTFLRRAFHEDLSARTGSGMPHSVHVKSPTLLIPMTEVTGSVYGEEPNQAMLAHSPVRPAGRPHSAQPARKGFGQRHDRAYFSAL